MLERAERRRRTVAYGIVMLAAIGHRMALFLLHRADLDAYIDANESWYTFQHLPQEMLRDHLFRSLLVLQQTPPVSNLLVGLALKCCAWPGGVAYALIWMQTAVSILTAVVLVHLVATLYPRWTVLWTAIGLVFVLNTDLVVLEYTSMGQLIYGPLAMLLSLVVVDRLAALRRTGRAREAAATGVATGLLALSRATWSYFALPCLGLVAALAGPRRARAVLACLLPIVVLQGGWALKNWAVYGVFSPATSALGGMHATTGLRFAGFGVDFGVFFQQHVTLENGYPDWAVLLAHPDPYWLVRLRDASAERDQWVERTFGLANPMINTLYFRELCALGQRVFLAFAWRHPGTMLTKWWISYHFFWQPIANYGQKLVALFVGENRIGNGLDLPGIVHQLRARTVPERHFIVHGSNFLMKEQKAPPGMTPTSLYTFGVLDPFVLMLNVVGVHLLLPLLAVAWVVQRVRGRPTDPVFDPLRMSVLLVAATVYGYLAGVANFVETAENMRYRLEVEPVIWVITLICLSELGWLVRLGLRSRGGALREDLDGGSRCHRMITRSPDGRTSS
jgi:hypothetical protein